MEEGRNPLLTLLFKLGMAKIICDSRINRTGLLHNQGHPWLTYAHDVVLLPRKRKELQRVAQKLKGEGGEAGEIKGLRKIYGGRGTDDGWKRISNNEFKWLHTAAAITNFTAVVGDIEQMEEWQEKLEIWEMKGLRKIYEGTRTKDECEGSSNNELK